MRLKQDEYPKRVLIHQTNGGDGHDPGETIHEATYGECREELGLAIENVVLTGLAFEGEVKSRAF
ncbi:hypothetical protein ACFW4D_18985 [Paenibacillus lactis]|uniref:hypothetical protein n=1 Tax=Paenibacillus lactis TaxID=228574 RepID=UPI0005519A4F